MNLEEELKRLIGFKPITSDTGACSELLKYTRKYYENKGLKTECGEITKHPYLLATTGSELRKTDLLLQAHIDVVPASGAMLKVVKKGDKIFGRGTYDMLFAAACFNRLVSELSESGDLKSINLGIMLTSDEEIGGQNGVGALFENYDCNICVLPDAGTDKEICIEAKGVLQLRITIPGVAGHGARPWQTDSPILNCLKSSKESVEFFQTQTKRLLPAHSHKFTEEKPTTKFLLRPRLSWIFVLNLPTRWMR